MRESFARQLRCLACREPLAVHAERERAGGVEEGVLECGCGRRYPVIAGVPRILPSDLEQELQAAYPAYFAAHSGLATSTPEVQRPHSAATQKAFGDEWRRFPEIHSVHQRIFDWYFAGPARPAWAGLRVLDAGCGMGRWLHFAAQAGASVVGMDVSRAIEVVSARESVDCVQADLRQPPFAPGAFDLVYSLGVLHHLEDPLTGLRSLSHLVKPGGELRIYVYRSLDGDPWPRRVLLSVATQLRKLTTRLPFWAVQLVATVVASAATVLFLVPRRLLRRSSGGDRLTRGLPLVQYEDVPFRMLVAEQFDRLVAPIEGRYRREDVAAWFGAIGFETVEIIPGLGWRGIARRPG